MIPIIRIEVDSMRHVMEHAFSEKLLNLDENFKEAIADATKPEKIQTILNETANRFLREAIEKEVKSYFLFGEGLILVRKYIDQRMKEDLV